LLRAPLAVFGVPPQQLFEDVIGDMVGGALDETRVIVEKFTHGLFELDGTAHYLGWFLDVCHFLFLLWFLF